MRLKNYAITSIAKKFNWKLNLDKVLNGVRKGLKTYENNIISSYKLKYSNSDGKKIVELIQNLSDKEYELFKNEIFSENQKILNAFYDSINNKKFIISIKNISTDAIGFIQYVSIQIFDKNIKINNEKSFLQYFIHFPIENKVHSNNLYTTNATLNYDKKYISYCYNDDTEKYEKYGTKIPWELVETNIPIDDVLNGNYDTSNRPDIYFIAKNYDNFLKLVKK